MDRLLAGRTRLHSRPTIASRDGQMPTQHGDPPPGGPIRPTTTHGPGSISIPWVDDRFRVLFRTQLPASSKGKRPAMTEYEVHPAIGIARVGSSQLTSDEGFFIGSEPGAGPPAHYRDSAGNLKAGRAVPRLRLPTRRKQEAARCGRADARRRPVDHLDGTPGQSQGDCSP